jgi:hypothetical protein
MWPDGKDPARERDKSEGEAGGSITKEGMGDKG